MNLKINFSSIAVLVLFVLFCFCKQEEQKSPVDTFINEHRFEAQEVFNNLGVINRGDKRIVTVYENEEIVQRITYRNYDADDSSSLRLETQIDESEIVTLKAHFPYFSGVDIMSDLLKFGNELFRKMDKYHLRDVQHDNAKLGINTEFYITWEDRVWYVEDPSKITNSSWRSAIAKTRKFDDNWYYYNINDKY